MTRLDWGELVLAIVGAIVGFFAGRRTGNGGPR